MKGNDVRKSFLDYFVQRGHTVVRSSALVPANDPTLLFTNAGMVQFKDVFTGVEKRNFSRATTSQKCVRAGGKHNDLENVGHTARHHTFFEMLGNFSFGDYFKKDAIAFAWEWVTGELKLPTDRLAVTIFEGEGNVPADEEAAGHWRDQGVPPEKILRFGSKDNFWAMGDTGPCGPCSEIHYFQGADIPCAEEAAGRRCLGVGCDCDRWVEIWNLVFMQFERGADGSMKPLPRPSIDTGAGLERVTAIMQGKRNNYDTDLFAGLLAEGGRIARVKYGAGTETDVSLRVMADHARATAFLVADGVIPSNEGRGYVLRRIMRRAIRHGYKLGVKELFLDRLCGVVIDEMGGVYPELTQHVDFIRKVAQSEEEGFRQTLAQGMRLLDEEFDRMARDGEKVVSGSATFKLHDTYGFPTDLTANIASEKGFSVDLDRYEKLMDEQRERSDWKGSGDKKVESRYRHLRMQWPRTEFTGYDRTVEDNPVHIEAMANLTKHTYGGTANTGDEIEFVTNKTPFYAESGGQVGDTGYVYSKDRKSRLKVTGTIKPLENFFVHKGIVETGAFQVHIGPADVEDSLVLEVDADRRARIKAAHSATHLLHWALRDTLGEHVKQAGSLVDEDHTRLDFHHFDHLTPEQIAQVEDKVNEKITRNIQSVIAEVPIEEARKRGAMALFGEKYGDVVRLVEFEDKDSSFASRELCGGTHVDRTGDIGYFKIVSEGSVAAGVRRIEAFTGRKAADHVHKIEAALKAAAQRLKCAPGEVDAKVEALYEQVRDLERQIEGFKDRISSAESKKAADGAREVSGVRAIAVAIDNADPAMLRSHADRLKEQIKSGVVLVGTVHAGKASFVCGVTADLTKRFNAGKIVGAVAAIVGGKGGGRPDMAQAGGPEAVKLDEAIAKFYDILETQGK